MMDYQTNIEYQDGDTFDIAHDNMMTPVYLVIDTIFNNNNITFIEVRYKGVAIITLHNFITKQDAIDNLVRQVVKHTVHLTNLNHMRELERLTRKLDTGLL